MGVSGERVGGIREGVKVAAGLTRRSVGGGINLGEGII